MRKITGAIGGIIFALALSSHELYADMGRVVAGDAQLSEDAQKAIILHNGTEEILILGTDMKSDKKTGFIRFIPFPTEPQVALAPEKSFDAAQALIKKYALKTAARSKSGVSMGPAVELTFQQKLGAHDMTVIKVNDIAGFKTWVNDFFKKKSLPQKESYPEVETVVQDYVKRGIVYFALDFVELDGPARSIEPLMYRFNDKELYYPLVTSNTFGGNGTINLIVVCPRTIGTMFEGSYPGLPMTETSTSARTSAEDLKGILPDAAAFFKDQPRLYMQMINYYGAYSFQRDFTFEIAAGVDYEVYFKEDMSFLDDVMGGLMDRLPEDMPVMGSEFETFASEYFTVEVPKGWPQNKAALNEKAAKEYGVVLRGPQSNEGMYLTIELIYYAPDHGMFTTHEKYIRLNTEIDDMSKVLGETVTQVQTIAVSGRKAYQFEIRTVAFIPPGAVEPKKVPVLERVVVLPVSEGFYVLRYKAPMGISDAHINIFKKMVEDFKPTK